MSITKLMAISFLIISFVPYLSSALEMQLNSPDSVNLNEEFTVSISTNTSETYDVKIFVEDANSTPKTISEIYNGEEWQSSYFYLKQAFPNQTEFRLKIKKAGEWEICLRLRKDTPSTPVCNPIIVNGINQEEENESNSENNMQDINQEEENENMQDESSSKEEINETEPKTEEKSQASIKQKQNIKEQINTSYKELTQLEEKIILNSKPKEIEQNKLEFATKYQKLRLSLIYTFIALCVFIIILLSIRKL